MTTLLIVIFTCIFIIELSISIVYGRFLTYEEVLHFIISNKPFKLNPLDTSIVSGNFMKHDSGHFSTVPIPILSKYYIYGRGRVFRWSKAHKQLEALHKNLKINNDFL